MRGVICNTRICESPTGFITNKKIEGVTMVVTPFCPLGSLRFLGHLHERTDFRERNG